MSRRPFDVIFQIFTVLSLIFSTGTVWAQGADPSKVRAAWAGVVPGVGLAKPSLAVGLNGLADWSTQHPFVDLVKTARPWVGHLKGQWGGFEAEQLEAEGHLSPEGWPLRIPETVSGIEMLLLTEQPPEATSLATRYELRYKGRGRLTLTGRISNLREGSGRISFDFSPGEGSVGILVTATDALDPIRDISVFRAEDADLFEAGVVFNPRWLRLIRDFRVLRYMDWMITNNSPVKTWQDRPRLSDYTWVRRGVPLEIMVKLANQTGADPWFNMPHMADTDYLTRFAAQVYATLDPRRHAYVEYSNEVWNFSFEQARWAQAQAAARWPGGEDGEGWMNMAGIKAAEAMAVWTKAFAEDADRLVRVAGVFTGWPGLEFAMFEAPMAPDLRPADWFDAYAVTGYFGLAHDDPGARKKHLQWLSESRRRAEIAADDQDLGGAARADFVERHKFDAGFRLLAEDVKAHEFKTLTEELLPYHAETARKYGLDLVMYEGGTHIIATGLDQQDETFVAFLTAFNYSQEVAELYRLLLAKWDEVGGTMFNVFVDVAPPSVWGSWGMLRHLDDSNFRADVLAAANRHDPADTRPAGAFLHGDVFSGTDGNDVLSGTHLADILLGGGGDDLLVVAGDGDRIIGGAGQDIVMFRGDPSQYQFFQEGTVLRAVGPRGTAYLTGIETVRFVP